jgi:ribonuclease R
MCTTQGLGKEKKTLQSPATFLYSSRPWWERFFFPKRMRYRMAVKLLHVFEMGAHRNFSAYELARDMGVRDINGQCAIDEALRYLFQKGKIEQIYPGKFRLRNSFRITGIVDLSFPQPELICGSYSKPVHILPDYLRGASQGDTVLVNICRVTPKYLEAEVLRILKFANYRVAGTLEILEQRAYFTPFNRDVFCDIEIPLKFTKKAKNGDSVVIRFFYSKANNNRRITGKVIKILGEAGLGQVQNFTRLESNGFPIQFSTEEYEAAAAIDFEIPEPEIAKRIDMREVTAFTIDPADTKDIDDALSIRTLDNGHFEVGVHIADVTHYVKAGSVLDEQAYKRTTSVYLPERVLPMFPDTLTHGCSLFPRKDRLTFSVIFELDNDARILHYKIAKTVIRSQRQFSYREVQKILDKPMNDCFSPALNTLYMLSQKLRRKRLENGTISFNNHPELCFEFDDGGNVIDVRPRKRIPAMRLVEEFMLLANRSVAETAAKKYIPFIYRSHGSPKLKLFGDLCRVASNYGYTLQEGKSGQINGNRIISKNISGFLSQVKTDREGRLFSYLTIRSMSQGKYSEVPRRHFALAFDHYTQFTSPIRRYADIDVHRMIARELIDSTEQTGIFDYEDACKHFNRMQQKAKCMTRFLEQQKCAEFLLDKIGRILEGTIIYVTAQQLVVELSESGIRGRILIPSLKDDRYRMDYNTYIVWGASTGRSYQTGDKLRVRIIAANVNNGLIDFSVA